MNIILFFFVIIISFIVIRIGAIAFHVTGIEWSLSKFQALSCFTSTGFTTREAELIVRHLQRRRIATILMILGNAGFVLMIATFANSFRAPAYLSEIHIPYLNLTIKSQLFPWINLLIIVIVLFVGSKIISKTRLLQRVTVRIKRRLEKKQALRSMTFEEIVISTGGYGVLNAEVVQSSFLLDKTIGELGLRNRGVLILLIERDDSNIPVPSFDTKILLGDRLVCFGHLEDMRQVLSGQ